MNLTGRSATVETTVNSARPEAQVLQRGVDTGRGRRHSWWPALGSVLGGSALIAVHASFYGRWLVDDSGITFSYARNIAQGHGPVLQPGATPVEAFSNPAWLALLVAGRLIGLFDHGTLFGVPDYVLYPKALALACCVGILAAFYTAAHSVSSRPGLVTFVSGGALAAIPSFVIWSFSGLENSLYALAVVTLAVVLVRAVVNKWVLSSRAAILTGALAALAALTRPDGAIYVATYPLVVLVFTSRANVFQTIRWVALSVATFLAPYGGYVAWRYAEFGQLLPNTAIAKDQALPTIDDLARAANLIEYTGWLLVVVAAACTGVVLSRPSRLRSGLIALLVTLALSVTAYCILNPDWMPQYRFATPVWPLATLTATLAISRVVGWATSRGRLAVSLTLAVAVLSSLAGLAEQASEFRDNPTVPLCLVADRYGRTVNAYADILGLRHASLLTPDLGGTALTSRLQLVDLTGLANRRIAEFWAADDMAELRDYIFEVVKPTFIHTHGGWSARTGIPSDPRLAENYHVVHTTSSGQNGDWVRKDAVSNPGRLEDLRSYAKSTISWLESIYSSAPRRSCGPTLRRGQTPWLIDGSRPPGGPVGDG